MQFSVVFRHMEPSDALKSYARERMDRVRKYMPDPIGCHVVFSTERHNHRVDVNFQLHNGLTVAGHETTENMYSSIDLVIAKIERQVRRYKGKVEEQRVRPHHVEPLPWSHSIVEEAFSGPTTEAPPDHPAYTVERTESFHANPMSVADAIAQLNLAHQTVLVFRSTEAEGRIAVVYRRDDGKYGLIETPAMA
ncbi:MAG: ribosome-associated translation inhibitor RaiA [Myxococcales bacterium]|nr:ribosome-associated translation inhibitor RaiA [Myxococcales bacterium]